MPPPIVNQTRDVPNEQPTISLSLLHQVGGVPGAPGAGPSSRRMSQCFISRLILTAKPKSMHPLHLNAIATRFRPEYKEGD
jgi:hypothetical protein